MKKHEILRPNIESSKKSNLIELVRLCIFIIKSNPILTQPTIGNTKIGKPFKYLILPKIKIEPPINIKEEGGDPDLSTSE